MAGSRAVFTAWECVCDELPEQHYYGQGCSRPGCGCEAGWLITGQSAGED